MNMTLKLLYIIVVVHTVVLNYRTTRTVHSITITMTIIKYMKRLYLMHLNPKVLIIHLITISKTL